MKNNKKRFDIRSLGFKLWCYFILFAAILIVLIWLLQIYFMDSFYEDMKLRETKRMAQELIDEYKHNGKDFYSIEFHLSLRVFEPLNVILLQ